MKFYTHYVSIAAFVILSSGLSANDNVVSLQSKAFIFDMRKKSLSASENVQIDYKSIKITSRSSHFDFVSRQMQLSDQILVTFPGGDLRTDSLLLSLNDRILYGNTAVVSHFQDYQLNAGKIRFNMKDNTVTFLDNPRIKDASRNITGDNIIVDITQQSIQLKGHSKLDNQ